MTITISQSAEALCERLSTHHLIICKCEYLCKSKNLSRLWIGIKCLLTQCQTGKTSVMILDPSERTYKDISEYSFIHSTVSNITLKWKTFQTFTNLPRSGRPTTASSPQSQTVQHWEKWQDSYNTAETIQASVNMLNAEVHDHKNQTRTEQVVVCLKRKWLVFLKLHLYKLQHFFSCVFQTKVKISGLNSEHFGRK